MTVNTTISTAGPYSGDGSTTQFPFDFPVLEVNQVVVTLILADHSRVVLEQTQDYQITLNPDPLVNPGGVIEYQPSSGPLGADESLWIERRVVLVQPLHLPVDGFYPPAQIEAALDRRTLMAQQ
jgi:hypothetical protein